MNFKRIMTRPLSPFKRRTLFSILVLAAVMAIGTEGMVLLEGWTYVDAFYFMSLIATTQGPTRNPATDTGKIFASGMAFISVGAVISSIAFVFGLSSEHYSRKESTTWRSKRSG